MKILAIESSCDDTAAAVIDAEKVLASVVSSQPVHETWGGVVPELASREHMKTIQPVVGLALQQAGLALEEIEGIAATRGPGLAGSLLVGFHFAKALALSLGKPFLGINHMEGHVYAPFISGQLPPLPMLVLIVSGGHTQLIRVAEEGRYELLGQTLDDAAGEAFDKVAKLLDLGYPGGPAISREAAQGHAAAFAFPRGLKGRPELDFSFSGLKTAVLHTLRGLSEEERLARRADLCASFEEAVVDPLVEQSLRAIDLHKIRSLVLAGGVAANRRLRERLQQAGRGADWQLILPELAHCTDNAVMIARAAHGRLLRGERSSLDQEATPRFSLLELSESPA